MSIAEKFVTMEYGPAPEDPKEVQAWLDRHGHRFEHFINGTWQAPADGKYFETVDPSNGEKLASVAQGSPTDIDAAVRAARAAFHHFNDRSMAARFHDQGALRYPRRLTEILPRAQTAPDLCLGHLG